MAVEIVTFFSDGDEMIYAYCLVSNTVALGLKMSEPELCTSMMLKAKP